MGCGSSKGVNSVVVPSATEVIVKDHTVVKPRESEPEPLTATTRGGSSKGVNSVVVPSAPEVIVKDHNVVKPLESKPAPLTAITRGTDPSRSTFSKENSSATSSCFDVPVHSRDCAQATQKDQSKPLFGSSQRMFGSAPMFGSQRAFGENGKLLVVDTRQR